MTAFRVHAPTQMQVSAPQITSVSHLATSAHVARRRRIGPALLRALTEGREAVSTKAVTIASTPALPP
jgi:hypothetical protein